MELLQSTGAAFVLDPLLNGHGTILYQSDRTILSRETICGTVQVFTLDPEEAVAALERVDTCDLLTTNDALLAKRAQERFSLHGCNPCYFVVYEKTAPPAMDCRLAIAPPDDDAMRLIRDNYHMASDEELSLVRQRGDLVMGYLRGSRSASSGGIWRGVSVCCTSLSRSAGRALPRNWRRS